MPAHNIGQPDLKAVYHLNPGSGGPPPPDAGKVVVTVTELDATAGVSGFTASISGAHGGTNGVVASAGDAQTFTGKPGGELVGEKGYYDNQFVLITAKGPLNGKTERIQSYDADGTFHLANPFLLADGSPVVLAADTTFQIQQSAGAAPGQVWQTTFGGISSLADQPVIPHLVLPVSIAGFNDVLTGTPRLEVTEDAGGAVEVIPRDLDGVQDVTAAAIQKALARWPSSSPSSSRTRSWTSACPCLARASTTFSAFPMASPRR